MMMLLEILSLLVQLTVVQSGSSIFGENLKSRSIPEIHGFPDGADFHDTYTKVAMPVRIVGGAKDFPAYNRWSDEYLKSISLEKSKLFVGGGGKEYPKDDPPYRMLTLKQFLEEYNETKEYLTHSLIDAKFIAKEILLPFPLQCLEITRYGGINETSLWFSSGGTNSLVHTDMIDNIICVLRGEKQFTLVDPYRYGIDTIYNEKDVDNVVAWMDYDNVDLDLFPVYAKAEYWKTTLTAGDCLLIPFKWIHQVYSPGNNIAVSFWYHEYLDVGYTKETCNRELDKSLTMDKVRLNGTGYDDDVFRWAFGKELESLHRKVAASNPATFEEFVNFCVNYTKTTSLLPPAWKSVKNGHLVRARKSLKEAFDFLDINKNSVLEADELFELQDEGQVLIVFALVDMHRVLANRYISNLDESYYWKNNELTFSEKDEL